MTLRKIGLAVIGILAVSALTISWFAERGRSIANDPLQEIPSDGGAIEKQRKGEEVPDVDSRVSSSTQTQITAQDPISVAPSVALSRLMRLRERADAGEGLAQFELAAELSNCSRAMQFDNPDPMTITDKQMREFVQMCRSFGKSSDEFRAEAQDWEERLERDEVPSAVAMKVIQNLKLEPDDDAISQARAMVGPLLASGDPYVYVAAGVLSEHESNPAVGAAWHFLACEDNNDTAICGPHSTERWMLCSSGYECDEETSIAEYYYIKFPEYYDEGLGIAMALKEKIENGRYDEVWD